MSKTENSNINQIVLASQLDKVEVSADLIKTENFSKSYDSLLNLIKYLESIKETVDGQVRKIIEDNYQETGETSIKTDSFNFTYVAPTTKQGFDKDKLKSEDPATYAKYIKVTNVKGQLKVTKRKKNTEEDANKKEAIDAEYIDF